jgi:hypothetical protein
LNANNYTCGIGRNEFDESQNNMERINQKDMGGLRCITMAGGQLLEDQSTHEIELRRLKKEVDAGFP